MHLSWTLCVKELSAIIFHFPLVLQFAQEWISVILSEKFLERDSLRDSNSSDSPNRTKLRRQEPQIAHFFSDFFKPFSTFYLFIRDLGKLALLKLYIFLRFFVFFNFFFDFFFRSKNAGLECKCFFFSLWGGKGFRPCYLGVVELWPISTEILNRFLHRFRHGRG